MDRRRTGGGEERGEDAHEDVERELSFQPQASCAADELDELDEELEELEDVAEEDAEVYEDDEEDAQYDDEEEEEEEEDDDEEECRDCHEDDEDDDDDGLPYPGFVPVTFGFLTQYSKPRALCLQIITNPYPFSRTVLA